MRSERTDVIINIAMGAVVLLVVLAAAYLV